VFKNLVGAPRDFQLMDDGTHPEEIAKGFAKPLLFFDFQVFCFFFVCRKKEKATQNLS